MPIARHPDVSTLMTCSAGSQPEALCAVVTSHLAICPPCMREFRQLEEIGVSLFENLASDQTVGQAPAPRAGARIIEANRHAEAGAVDGDVPWPLVEVIGHRLDDLAWRELAAGIWDFKVPLSPTAAGDLRLFRLAPGKGLPKHGHQGEELTLVLRGAYQDESGLFAIGDFSDLDDEAAHTVVATEAGCLLLIASENEPQFMRGLV